MVPFFEARAILFHFQLLEWIMFSLWRKIYVRLSATAVAPGRKLQALETKPNPVANLWHRMARGCASFLFVHVSAKICQWPVRREHESPWDGLRGFRCKLSGTSLLPSSPPSCSRMQVDNGITMDKHSSKLWNPLQVRFLPSTSPKPSRKFRQDISRPTSANPPR